MADPYLALASEMDNRMTLDAAVKILGATSEDELRELQRLAAGRTVLELGAHFGRSTIALASVARELVSVDHHQGDQYAGLGDSLYAFFSNLERAGVRQRVLAFVGPFERALPLLRPLTFEVLFLDGCHAYEAVKRDIELALPLLTPQAALAFHDYGPDYFGVKRAVDDLLERWGRVGWLVGTLYVVGGV